MPPAENAQSARQQRAEKLAQQFRTDSRKPVVIEFAGMPKAGKTSTIGQVQTFLKRCGFSVKVVVERASVCPIRDKKHVNFNVWTACMTLAQLLEHTQDPPRPDDPDVLILDRGLFDAICWLRMMDELSRIRTADRSKIELFLVCDDWRRRLTGVVVMTALPVDALKREQGMLPVTKSQSGAGGSIMNHEVLSKFLSTTKACIADMKGMFPIFEVDTSGASANTPQKSAEYVADHVLNLIESQLSEEILHLSRSSVVALFQGRTCLDQTSTNQLLEHFGKSGRFQPRRTVEDDKEAVQALPVVVVRNKTGDILVLRRREKQTTSELHEKLVLWAGGHVRIEDGKNGQAIVQGALRELNEELRLSVEPEELKLLGAVYIAKEKNGKLAQHVALVFEWRAATDDVAVSLSTSEFFERRGTSLSGRFVPIAQIVEDIRSKKLCEEWSRAIVEGLLPETGKQTERLFV